MILCVDTKALKTLPDVQRDVNLEDIINSHTKYFSDVEEALKESYVPLDFSVTVRSLYTNLVLQINEVDKKRYYVNLTQVQPFVHKGYDLIMYLTSLGLMHSVDYQLGVDKVMLNHSQFQPIGVYNPDSAVLNPIIYTHIILTDEGAEELKQYLKSDREFVPISVLENATGNIRAMLDTIIEVKEDSNNEQCNND